GTTCFVDMHMFEGQSAKAAKDAGMRSFIGRGLVGDDLYAQDNPRFNEAMREKEAFESDTIKFLLSPHAIYSTCETLLRQVTKEADRMGLLKQIHLAESDFEAITAKEKYGKTPVEYLFDIGFLNDRTLVAHCVKVSQSDMDILKEKGCTVVTNPASNAKLGNGYAPVNEMVKKGINVCLGTDSVASNNTLNMFREMNLLTLLHKAVNKDCTALSSKTVLDMVTKNCAKGLNMKNELGVLKKDALADIIFLDLNAVSLFPNNNIVSSLCYCANGSEVNSVMINGRFVMKDRKLLTINENEVFSKVIEITNKYL
ncbi:MAG: amidohydrolase family protein, partial [Lachnospiraceae bacterium]|nr:amidohydrolase family protein [Lachnospiraceae bacterium]